MYVLLACVMLLGLTTWREWEARRVELHDVNTAVVNLARSLSQHADDTVEMADTALVGLVERLETDGTLPAALARLDRFLVMRNAALPRVRDFVIFDENGNWLATSMPAKGGNNADRPYFQHHRDLPDRGAYIGAPFLSRSSGRWTVAVTRRYEHPDGRFAGVVMATIDMSYFVDHYATYKLGTNGTVLLLLKSGTLLARYPFEEKAIGRDFSDGANFKEISRHPFGNYETVALIDGVRRYGGYRQSDRFPLIVLVGMSEDQALGAWRADAMFNLAIALGMTCLVLFLGWYLAQQTRDREASEIRVRESEARYRMLAESTSDAITCMDLDCKRTYVSPAYRAMFGYEPEEVLGRPMTAIVHPDDVDSIREKILPLASGETDRTQLTYRTRHKQGHWVWCEGSLSLLRDAGTGQPASMMICSIRDISERHAQAEELQRVNTELERLAWHLTRAREQAEQASRAKTRFLAGISHELRTPLNGIMGYAQLLRMEGGLNAAQVARVDAMLGAGTHLLEMINSVLDLSQIEAEQLEIQAAEVDLHVVAAACLDLVRPTAEAKQLDLRLVAAPDVPRRVMTDPVRLRQVLLNLVGNAVKFTVEGSVELRLRTVADGTGLRLEVADTGPGIPPEHRAQLFQDFQRLGADAVKVEGAGIGLALSARLAVLMGGSIGQEENPVGGSLFWLDLPLLACSAQPVPDTLANRALVVSAEDTAAKPAPAEHSLRVLVVDDVAMNRDIASSFLLAAGYEVVCTGDGVEALKAAETNDFDVILMDVRMPGMDGLEATRRIRALAGPRGRVPIVALTAQAFVEQVEECCRAGMDSHLAKPFTLETLCAAVRHAAAKASSDKATNGGGSAPAPLPSTHKVCPRASEAIGIGAELPVLDRAAFERTTAYLAPEAVATYLRMLSERCEVLLRKLRAPDALKEGLAGLAPLAHTLAGSAGMFGFQRLAEAARTFEYAVETKSPETLGQIERLAATLKISVYEMQRNTAALTATPETNPKDPAGAHA